MYKYMALRPAGKLVWAEEQYEEEVLKAQILGSVEKDDEV